MVVDCVSYNGEEWAFDIRYHILKDRVDQFVVVEFDRTFSGKPKEPTFPVERYPDVKHHFIRETQWSRYLGMAAKSPNTIGAPHWKTEFAQKESIKDCLIHLSDTDIVIIGDVDEVLNPDLILAPPWPVKVKLDVYTYYLNNRSNESFHGPILALYGDIKDRCLNHIRTHAHKTDGVGGWHFTSMGGPLSLLKKLEDSYTHESYATPEVLENVAYNIANGKDFLGRNFTYTRDESQWPQYLRENREKYTNLLLPGSVSDDGD